MIEVLKHDIYDRFFVYFSLCLVVYQNYSDNKISSHNFVDYTYRLVFLILSEILFDWIKDIIAFKISGCKVKILKELTDELVIFHEKLKYNCFNSNGKINTPHATEYVKKLDESQLSHLNKAELNNTMNFLDYDNILCVELSNNITIPCIIVKIHTYINF